MANHEESQSQKSINETIRLLNDILSNPAGFYNQAGLRDALKSQAAFARYTNPLYGIIASSLNTFKRNCALYAYGGFADVDNRRKAAATALTFNSDPVKGRRKSQKELILSLQNEINSMRIDLLTLTSLLARSMNQTRYYASLTSDDSVLALFEKERRELLDILTCVDSNQWRSQYEKTL